MCESGGALTSASEGPRARPRHDEQMPMEWARGGLAVGLRRCGEREAGEVDERQAHDGNEREFNHRWGCWGMLRRTRRTMGEAGCDVAELLSRFALIHVMRPPTSESASFVRFFAQSSSPPPATHHLSPTTSVSTFAPVLTTPCCHFTAIVSSMAQTPQFIFRVEHCSDRAFPLS